MSHTPTFMLPTPTPIRKKMYSTEESYAVVDKYLHGVKMHTVWNMFPNVPGCIVFEWTKKK